MNRFYHNAFLLSLTLVTSCTQMLSHRDYLAEMEYDDAGMYQPNEDFPVMAGDTGRTWENEEERRGRTPASARDLESMRNATLLNNELRQLEMKQSETSMELYQLHRSKLATTSEKIYFLKLPLHERKEYLESRGFLIPTVQDFSKSSSASQTYRNQSNVLLGMSKDDVMNNWGKPSRVEVAGNPNLQNERWLYNFNGASKYIYFESGRVGGWE